MDHRTLEFLNIISGQYYSITSQLWLVPQHVNHFLPVQVGGT